MDDQSLGAPSIKNGKPCSQKCGSAHVYQSHFAEGEHCGACV